jgi:hypothetical protein
VKRIVGLMVAAGLLAGVGIGAVARADDGPAPDPAARAARSAKREAVRTCVEQARAANPDADRAALKVAVTACAKQAGIDLPKLPPKLPPELAAKRRAVVACLRDARAANQGGDKTALKGAAAACAEKAGIDVGAVKERLAKFRSCLSEARAAAPAGDRAEMRPLVRECLKKG